MKLDRKLQYGFLFLLLAGFTFAGLGMAKSSGELVTAVAALQDNSGKSTTYVSVLDQAFDAKVLRFLKQEKVCALSEEQVSLVSGQYAVETKAFDVNGTNVTVLYVNGNPLNKEVIETLVGEKLDTSCQVVHGNKVIALITPIFVS